jgi:two-component system sensor histidine kinase UhpB
VLLVVPFRAWPAYLLCAFPAQMLIAWRTSAPTLAMALLFITNATDAALGAFLVRKVSGGTGPFRFDGLRSVVVFALLGATLAPVLVSFADAGISVATGWAASYRVAFVTRVRSNILTHLIAVPALIDLLALDRQHVRAARVVEAAVLTALLVVTCAIAFAGSTGSEAFPALLYTPLPLLLWAAVRFGPGGTGWSVLLVATVASWNALEGRGPFTSRSPVDDVVSLQLFLLATSIPLLFLSAVIQERNRATVALQMKEAALRNSYARARELAGKLIAAQELERARIARDMHDDFNQQLAALSIAISGLRRRQFRDDAELHEMLNGLQERTVALTEQVRHFSNDLHPGMLDHAGLASALRTHCTEFAEQRQLQLSFTAGNNLGPIPRDVAICVYRIVQEGLRNVVDHAEVQAASVSLARSLDGLELTIADQGRGFDTAAALGRGGLGLLSMEERVRLTGGTLTITSAPGAGTMLHVRIPLAPASRAAGPAERI